MNDDQLLKDLTPAQCQAVTHVDGPMLVVAGAGSGKTRVVTRRVAHLIRLGIPPWRILALTFTNKAAGEMRERVEQLTGQAPAWMGTFHSICARMLRNDIHLLDDGRDNRFTILDQGDQESLIKRILKGIGEEDKSNRPSAILSAIGRAKSSGIPPEDYPIDSWKDETNRQVYAAYEKDLRGLNAVDFDDLLNLAVRLLEASPETLDKYRRRFPYLLVDEYQDTNRIQYRLLRALAGSAANLHATGDPDQSIYSWRGADYRNIMDFNSDFPGAKLVRLEENYRSGKFILEAANHLIRHNSQRIAKDLRTSRPGGEKVSLVRLQSDRMEAQWIAERIADLRREDGAYKGTALFYRTNAQSRALEEALMRAGIPYQLVGGVRFYERREVKDLLAHLKLRVNPRDLPSLRRVAQNRPGIGEKTVDKIIEAAEQAGESALAFLAKLADFGARAGFKVSAKTAGFSRWAAGLAAIDIERADIAVQRILAHSGLVETAMAAIGKDEAAEARLENLQSLSARAGDFVRMRLENAPVPDAEAGEEEIRSASAIDLPAFLEDVALVADVDNWASDADRAALMTLHSAKGLEFDNVFVTGLEEGLLPHRNSAEKNVDEERRLFYVGITRARKRAWITHAASRAVYGNVDFSAPSRFLEELPDEAVDRVDLGDSLSWESGSGFTPSSRKVGRSAAAAIAWEDDGDWDIGAPFEADADFDPDPDPDFAPDIDPDVAAAAAETAKAKRSFSLRPAGRKPASGKPSAFHPGDLVRHPLFGSGKVLTADRGKIMVQFFSAGTRLLQEDLAQLTRE